MSGSPFRDRRIPAEEIRRIVARAVELASSSAATNDAVDAEALRLRAGSQALTEQELIDRLLELGFSTDLAARAIADSAGRHDRTLGAAPLVVSSKAHRIVREELIDGMVAVDRLDEIAEAIDSVMKVRGRVSVVSRKLTWMPSGVFAEPTVTVHSKDGRTRIQYDETLVANGSHQNVGFSIAAVLCGLSVSVAMLLVGAAVAKAFAISAQQGAPIVLVASALLGFSAAFAMVYGLRRAFARRAQTRAAFADEVMARTISVTRSTIEKRGSPRSRVKLATAEEAASGIDADHEQPSTGDQEPADDDDEQHGGRARF